jgi:hypothetical protein
MRLVRKGTHKGLITSEKAEECGTSEGVDCFHLSKKEWETGILNDEGGDLENSIDKHY